MLDEDQTTAAIREAIDALLNRCQCRNNFDVALLFGCMASHAMQAMVAAVGAEMTVQYFSELANEAKTVTPPQIELAVPK